MTTRHSSPWRLRHAAPALAVAASVFAIAACGDDGNDGATIALADTDDTPAEPPTDVPSTGVINPVVALDNSFRPELVEVKVGDQVLWENRGVNEHDVLSIEGPDDWGIEVDEFQPGDVYVHTFTEPGEYRYFCSIHGIETVGMIGTVIVTA